MALLNPSQAPARVRRTVSSVAPTVLRALLEIALVLAVFELYRAGRLLARGESASAYEHALQVHQLEHVMHLPSEAWVQSLVPWDAALHAANIYYFSVHFPTMIAFLVWGYLFRPRAEYRWARNLVIALTCSALVVHIVYPLAPPRMFPQWGFVDTMATFGPNAYAGTSGAMANQFAAMPSLHIGWAALDRLRHPPHRAALAGVDRDRALRRHRARRRGHRQPLLDRRGGRADAARGRGPGDPPPRTGPKHAGGEGLCVTSAPWGPLTEWSPGRSTGRRSSSSQRA